MKGILWMTALAACTGDDPIYDTGTPPGTPQCGRVRGTTGVLLYQGGGDTVASPNDVPDATSRTTSVAGLDDLTYLAVTDGRVLRSEDAGCNWQAAGALPSDRRWALVAAGSRVYAFDADGGDGARTDDGGLNWTAFSAGEAFAAAPTVDAADPDRLRGVQARGVVTSSDGGDTWPVSGDLPAELPAPTTAAATPANLDEIIIGGVGGAWRTLNGGRSWTAAYAVGDVASVAVYPDDGDVVYLHALDAEGVAAIWRTEDAGGDWQKLVDAGSVEMGGVMPLWPVPGDARTVLSGYGPVDNSEGDPSLALYVVNADTGTHSVRITDYFAIHGMAFGADRWVAAVDSIPR